MIHFIITLDPTQYPPCQPVHLVPSCPSRNKMSKMVKMGKMGLLGLGARFLTMHPALPDATAGDWDYWEGRVILKWITSICICQKSHKHTSILLNLKIEIVTPVYL